MYLKGPAKRLSAAQSSKPKNNPVMHPRPQAGLNYEPIPARAGIGLRSPHYQQLLTETPDIGWLEAHAENYFGAGGQPLYFLEQLRGHYPLSLHGVGLSPGSAEPLNKTHLRKLKTIIDRFQPSLVSEHLCWNAIGGTHLNDLLPLPYTEEALAHISARLSHIQEYLGRQILIENLSSYLQFKHSTIPEWEFINETAKRSGCGILLDVNNIYVNACNHGFDSQNYLTAIDTRHVQEIHLAGFDEREKILIDTHSKRVDAAVWDLYRKAIDRFGATPTLIEWDTDIPALSVLLDEARKAEAILEAQHAAVA